MKVIGLDHVQLAMPPGREDDARRFYVARGGAWFEDGGTRVHLGVDPDFRPARKAHPGLLVTQLRDLVARLREAGHPVVEGEPLEGYDQVYLDDPFGNRLELMEPE